jgi:hypothetical protein
MDQPTGAIAPSPAMQMLIQMIAAVGVCAKRAP